jgi:hypothetical protein
VAKVVLSNKNQFIFNINEKSKKKNISFNIFQSSEKSSSKSAISAAPAKPVSEPEVAKSKFPSNNSSSGDTSSDDTSSEDSSSDEVSQKFIKSIEMSKVFKTDYAAFQNYTWFCVGGKSCFNFAIQTLST